MKGPILLRPLPRAHRLVVMLDTLMQMDGVTMIDLAKRSGIARDTMRGWWRGAVPNAANLDAAFMSLGYQLDIIEVSGPTARGRA